LARGRLMPELLARFARDDTGAAAIEYCLIAAGVGLAVFGAVKLIGPGLKALFGNVGSGFSNAGGAVPIERDLNK
jgi:pilus assembly protein Flp/PilA